MRLTLAHLTKLIPSGFEKCPTLQVRDQVLFRHTSDPKAGTILIDLETNSVYFYDEFVQCHRRDGPAIITFDKEGGHIIAEEWFERGQLHRDPEPAVIYYNSAGEIIEFKFYRRNCRQLK